MKINVLIQDGYKRPYINKLLTLDLFKGKSGYGEYTIDDIILLKIGHDLHNLGINFRHIEIILLQLKEIEFKDKEVLFIFSNPKGIKPEILPLIEQKIAEKKIRTTALSVLAINKKELVEILSKGGFDCIVYDLSDIQTLISK